MNVQNDTGSNESPLADYWTADEAAAALKVSGRTLTRWNSLREGPPRTHLGNRVLYHKDTVRAWLLAQQEDDLRRGAA